MELRYWNGDIITGNELTKLLVYMYTLLYLIQSGHSEKFIQNLPKSVCRNLHGIRTHLHDISVTKFHCTLVFVFILNHTDLLYL